MTYKKYLSKTEREDLLLLMYFADKVEEMLVTWGERKNLKAKEVADLQKSLEFALKGYESIIKRQDGNSLLAFKRNKESLLIYLDLPYVIKTVQNKRVATLESAYKENKDYYKFVELVMEKCCLKCKKKGGECEFNKEFEEQCIPSFFIDNEDNHYKNCRYAYDLDFLKK